VYGNCCSNKHSELACAAKSTPLDTYANDAAYYLTATGANGSAVVAARGYIDPKYMVVGVTYAPPGPSQNTFVLYQNSTFVGMTQSLSQSFMNGNMSTISLSYGFSIPLVANGKITTSSTTSASQTTKNTSTVTTSFQVQSGEETFGTGDYFAPVDHDYDQIWVWLNPALIFSVAPSVAPQWNGYGFDGTDQPGMDIVPIALGYLNGDFGAMPPDIQTSLNRTWAANQLPAGQDPALTVADLDQIASFDPFSVSTYGPTVIGSAPPSPETSDHRFTLTLCSPPTGTAGSSFNYLQANPSTSANVYTCQLTYTNLSTQAREITKSFSDTYTVDLNFNGSGFFSSFSAEIKNSYTLAWTTDSQNSITTSTTSMGNLSVQGPPCNNVVQGQGPCVPVYDSSGNEPTQFDIYQDNMFGTFMFAPVHFY